MVTKAPLPGVSCYSRGHRSNLSYASAGKLQCRPLSLLPPCKVTWLPNHSFLSIVRSNTSCFCLRNQIASAHTTNSLQTFLGWIVANGVDGIGNEKSLAGIFEEDTGERGLIALQDISEGEAIFCVPLRLAIIDHPSRGVHQEPPYPDAPWSVRLAVKLVEMLQEGEDNKWEPYLQVLPSSVPSPHSMLSWDEIQAIEYQPMLDDFYRTSWMLSSAGSQLQAHVKHVCRSQLEWALSVVHSRSFGSPGEGGVPVRMLVPLVDLLNHAGDMWVDGGGSVPQFLSQDNVRWDVKPPSEEKIRSANEGVWHMLVSATRDIQKGEELLLSYGERSNDSFFQHYGFVPPRNPHDDVILFESIEQGVNWLLQAICNQVTDDPSSVHVMESMGSSMAAALKAAAQQSSSMAPQPVATSQEEQDIYDREVSRIRLRKGARLDGRLVAAFEALAAPTTVAELQGTHSDGIAGEFKGKLRLQQQFHQLVALRCQQLLNSMPSTLLDDLEVLAQWQDPGADIHGFDELLVKYKLDIQDYCDKTSRVLDQPFGSAENAALYTELPSNTFSKREGMVDAGAGKECAELMSLVAGLQSASPSCKNTASFVSSAVLGEGLNETEKEEGGSDRFSMLPIVYRAYKKMILWDAILAAGLQ